MNANNCTLCNMPVRPGEPAAHTAPIDIRDGRIVTLQTRSYHTGWACRDAKAAYSASVRTAAVA